jgi:hypothetical protein
MTHTDWEVIGLAIALICFVRLLEQILDELRKIHARLLQLTQPDWQAKIWKD